MVYRCLHCNHAEARGCLPTVSCGLYLIVLFAIASSMLFSLVPLLAPEGLGWWWLAAGPILLAASVALSIALNWTLEFLEWAAFVLLDCRMLS